ncbi:hypothetical protein [Brevundimonas sp.]|jgi:hypothetical protein|uniref:hypothetical protein n=1 Tax=Brevundimonas sp. TaxID=1871086 RepID=UPI0028B23CAB|nr:hypothetical protein [Brevundimonas sp.]
MQDHHAELIDLDAYTDLLEASVIIETTKDGELLVHMFKHPARGILTGIQAGSAVFLFSGSCVDLREPALTT